MELIRLIRPTRLDGTIRSRIAVLFLVLAVLFQGGIVQTHNHLGSGIVSASDQYADPGVPTVSRSLATGKSQPTAPPSCPLCQDQALFGSYMLATPAAFAPPVAIQAWYLPTLLLSSVVRQSSHAWRSRAPPAA